MDFQQTQDQSTQKDNLIGWHVVAFLDLLGQQDALRKVTALPNLERQEEVDAFKRKVIEFYEPLKALRKWFGDSIISYMDGGIKDRTSKEQEILQKFRSTPIFYRNLSDCVIVNIPLRDDIGKFPGRAIFGILAASAITFISCISHKWAIRGGIDLGLAMELDGDEIYGPAIARAYALESKVAQYPRIVIGKELISYFKEMEKVIGNPDISIDDRVNAGVTIKSQELIAEDYDGQIIVDYLGVNIRNAFPHPEIIHQAYKFIIEECVRHKKTGNSKLGFRYTLIRNYFESRLPEWGITIERE
jgi:hypothetical protein